MSRGEVREETPALRFLNRGRQLNRIQQRVLEQVMSEIHAEQAGLPTEVRTPEEVQEFVAKLVAGIGSSHERWADIGLTLQLFYCRHVDNFQIFLEELLRIILIRQSGLLKRGEPVPMDEIITHSSMEEFVEASVDRHIHRLAYKSIEDFSQIIREQTGFLFFSSSKRAKEVEQIFALRNLITHSYGIVNRLYLSKYPDPNLRLGEPFPYTPEEIKIAWETLMAASTDIENRGRQKFKLFASGD
jgi:hypothetical protein